MDRAYVDFYYIAFFKGQFPKVFFMNAFGSCFDPVSDGLYIGNYIRQKVS